MTKETYKKTFKSKMNRLKRTFKERFFKRVDKTSHPNGCWLWTGSKYKSGYGTVYKGRAMLTHRVSWEFVHGKIPKGLLACHKCDNKPCCNPDHIFLGTYSDNMNDAIKKGRIKNYYIGKKGEDAPNYKLTWKKVEMIRRDYESGKLTLRSAGKLYDVSCATIFKIVHKKSW